MGKIEQIPTIKKSLGPVRETEVYTKSGAIRRSNRDSDPFVAMTYTNPKDQDKAQYRVGKKTITG